MGRKVENVAERIATGTEIPLHLTLENPRLRFAVPPADKAESFRPKSQRIESLGSPVSLSAPGRARSAVSCVIFFWVVFFGCIALPSVVRQTLWRHAFRDCETERETELGRNSSAARDPSGSVDYRSTRLYITVFAIVTANGPVLTQFFRVTEKSVNKKLRTRRSEVRIFPGAPFSFFHASSRRP